MKQKKLTRFGCLLFAFFLTIPTPAIADGEMTFKEYLESSNNHMKAYRHFSAIEPLKEATRLGGNRHPSLHMRLAILYYGLGLIPDAIAEGEKAVQLVPSSKWYKYDLAKFYFVDKQLNKAESQFMALLELDPGFTLGYYYLAEVYFQRKQYDMAWLSLTRALLLGHQGARMLNKLSPLTSKPVEDFSTRAGHDKLFRFIKLSTQKKAMILLDEINKGKLFDILELEQNKDKDSNVDFGILMLSELKESVAAALENSTPYSSPVVVKTGRDFSIIQRIAPFDPAVWRNVISVTRLSSRLAAFYTLESWKKYWQTNNTDRYFAAYSKNFEPSENMSHAAWKKKKTEELAQSDHIHTELIDPVVEMLTPTEVIITFKQIYETDSYQNGVMKTLTMRKEEKGWKIVAERVTKTLPDPNQ